MSERFNAEEEEDWSLLERRLKSPRRGTGVMSLGERLRSMSISPRRLIGDVTVTAWNLKDEMLRRDRSC